MFTSAAVCTSVYFYSLCVSILFFLFCPDMPQFPPVVTNIVMLILKDLILHVVILPDVFPISTTLSLFVILELDIAGNPVSFQIQQVLFTAVAAVSSHCLQRISKRFPVLFQNRDQRMIVCPVIAYISVDDKVILHRDLDIVCWF